MVKCSPGVSPKPRFGPNLDSTDGLTLHGVEQADSYMLNGYSLISWGAATRIRITCGSFQPECWSVCRITADTLLVISDLPAPDLNLNPKP